jgi:hypothetical protein
VVGFEFLYSTPIELFVNNSLIVSNPIARYWFSSLELVFHLEALGNWFALILSFSPVVVIVTRLSHAPAIFEESRGIDSEAFQQDEEQQLTCLRSRDWDPHPGDNVRALRYSAGILYAIAILSARQMALY